MKMVKQILKDSLLYFRHMVATRDIKPGEVIFTEKPLSFGPSENTKPVCIGCYSPTITIDSPRCKRCGFPVCSEKCSQIPEHRDYECSVLQKNNYKVSLKSLYKRRQI